MKKEIIRKCVVTNERKSRNLLFRVVKTPTGDVIVDLTYKQNGRGAYISKDLESIKLAKQKNILGKALETKIPDEIYEQLISLL